MSIRVFLYNLWHLIFTCNFHLKSIKRIMLCWIIHILWNSYVFITIYMIGWHYQTTISIWIFNVNNRIEDLAGLTSGRINFWFYFWLYYTIGLENRLLRYFDLPNPNLFHLSRLIRALFLIKNILDSKIAILPKPIIFIFALLADTTLIIKGPSNLKPLFAFTLLALLTTLILLILSLGNDITGWIKL